MKHNIRYRNTQRGAVLAIGLILLAVATLVTLTALNTGIMQESMTANQDNNARSFMAAEAGGAALVSWINKELENGGGKITQDHPDEGYEIDVVEDDSSLVYVFNLHGGSSWDSFPLKVLIEGRALAADDSILLARTQLLVEWREPPPGGPNPPAAISCFHGPCTIRAGAGEGADEGYGTVSGFNHPTPPLDCTGQACRMIPTGAEDMGTPAVPAVYLEDGGSVSLQGGNHNAYQGRDPSDPTETIIGNNGDVAWSPDAFTANKLDVPNWDDVFDGVDLTPTDLTGIGGNATEVFSDGPLVIDGTDFEMKGTSLFVGVIVIRKCGSIRMAGNPNVYGAIIVDAEGCGDNYDPFAGGGTPAVRYQGASGGGGPPGTGGSRITYWSEYSK